MALFLAALLISGTPARSADPPCPPPPLVAERVGRAQIFTYRIADKAKLLPLRDIVWGEDNPVPGVYSMKYMPFEREPGAKHDLAWFVGLHSDWIARKCDGEPAYEFGDSGYVPLDISNPAVRRHIEEEILADTKGKDFAAIAADNVEAENVFKRCGVLREGALQKRYSGAEVDPAYARDVADWMRELRARAHTNGMCLAANHYYSGRDRLDYLAIAANIDILVDEHGYTRKCRPMVYGAAWLDRVSLYAMLAREKPLIIIDQVCPTLDALTNAVVDWSLANYLLIKGDRTYLAITGEEYGRFFDLPELYLELGAADAAFAETAGVYYRRFRKALALVNPSEIEARAFELARSEGWRDHRTAQSREGAVVLPPGSGLVLVR